MPFLQTCVSISAILKTEYLMKEIAEELLKTIRFIPIEERQSKWYKEYLDKVNKALKSSLEMK